MSLGLIFGKVFLIWLVLVLSNFSWIRCRYSEGAGSPGRWTLGSQCLDVILVLATISVKVPWVEEASAEKGRRKKRERAAQGAFK